MKNNWCIKGSVEFAQWVAQQKLIDEKPFKIVIGNDFEEYYTIDDNGNWAIIGCKELSDYFKSIGEPFWTGDCPSLRYTISGGGHWNPAERNKEYKTITLQQFLNMNDKKIIGYLVKPEFANVAAKVTGVTKYSLNDIHDGCHFRANSIAKQRLYDAQVLDLWCTPVYEESFKVGDIIVIVDPKVTSSCTLEVGDIVQIKEVRKTFVITSKNPRNGGDIKLSGIRHATPEEIEQYNNNLKQFNVRHLCDILIVEVSKKGIYVPSRNMWINEHDLYRIINMTKIKLQYTSNPDNFTGMAWEVSLNTINIGCKKDVSVQDLIPVMEYYDSIQ